MLFIFQLTQKKNHRSNELKMHVVQNGVVVLLFLTEPNFSCFDIQAYMEMHSLIRIKITLQMPKYVCLKSCGHFFALKFCEMGCKFAS